jgi:hypothetical protein
MAKRLSLAGGVPFMNVALLAVVGLLLGFAGYIALPEAAIAATPRSLDIYFIDVEGGQSTLLVTPKRESLLIDAGWAGNGMRIGHRSVARDDETFDDVNSQRQLLASRD